VGEELPEERPHRRDVGVGLAGDVGAEVARSTRPSELVERLLVGAERGQVREHRAVPPAGERRFHPLRRQAVVSGDARDVPVSAHRCTWVPVVHDDQRRATPPGARPWVSLVVRPVWAACVERSMSRIAVVRGRLLESPIAGHERKEAP
jgi:hypothetical protein